MKLTKITAVIMTAWLLCHWLGIPMTVWPPITSSINQSPPHNFASAAIVVIIIAAAIRILRREGGWDLCIRSESLLGPVLVIGGLVAVFMFIRPNPSTLLAGMRHTEEFRALMRLAILLSVGLVVLRIFRK